MTVTLLTNYYILEEDKALAQKRIEEIEREILELGPAFHEALAQTSETDNAPLETLRERQSVLAAELQSLKEVLSKAAPTVPKADRYKASIGSLVKLRHNTDKSHRQYVLAGHWSYRTGQVVEGHALVITCQSPLGASLLGKQVGDTVTLPNKQQLTLVSLT